MKEAKVTSEPTAERDFFAKCHTSHKLSTGSRNRVQMVMSRVPHPDEVVKGGLMSKEAKINRIVALKLCLKKQKEVECAEGLTTVRATYHGTALVLKDLAMNSKDKAVQMEMFLCLTFSGLL